MCTLPSFLNLEPTVKMGLLLRAMVLTGRDLVSGHAPDWPTQDDSLGQLAKIVSQDLLAVNFAPVFQDTWKNKRGISPIVAVSDGKVQCSALGSS